MLPEGMSYADVQRSSIDVAVACANAGRADLIGDAIDLVWNNGRSRAVEFVARHLNATDAPIAQAPSAAPLSTPTSATASSGFMTDALAAAIEKRFRSQNPAKA